MVKICTYLFYIPEYKNNHYKYNYGFGNGVGYDCSDSDKLKCYFCDEVIHLTGENKKGNFRLSLKERGVWLYLNCHCKPLGEHLKSKHTQSNIFIRFNTNTLLEEFVSYSKKVMML